MGSELVRWNLSAGMGSVLLLSFPSLSFDMTVSSVGQAAEKSDLIDINAATAKQLKALPEIWDTDSEKIIKGRPYDRKDELVKKKVVLRAT
ncbi:MAG: hypothetical protein AAB308_09225 [Nitrospirota bacterium]|mgnify:CR=1 FL=1